MKLIIKSWKRYLNEGLRDGMPPKGHMPYPAGYEWPPETKEFANSVKELYKKYKTDRDLEAFRMNLIQFWNALESKNHGLEALNDLTDEAEKRGDPEADDFIDVMLDTLEDWR